MAQCCQREEKVLSYNITLSLLQQSDVYQKFKDEHPESKNYTTRNLFPGRKINQMYQVALYEDVLHSVGY